MHVAEPLLKNSSSNSASWQFKASFFTFFSFIFTLCGLRIHHHFHNLEKPIALELPGSVLAGCKVITGAYVEHFKGFLSKEVHLAQKGCMGRDIEIGSKFTVFGNVVTMEEKKGEIQPDGSIKWPDGQVWSPLGDVKTTSSTPAPAPTSSTTPPPCDNISGYYLETLANGEQSDKDIFFTQTLCTGFDKNNIPFTVSAHTVNMNYQGVHTEGQIAPDGTITWSNGYIHTPKLAIGKLGKATSNSQNIQNIVQTIKTSSKD